MLMRKPDEQFKEIKRGTVEILLEQELRQKLEHSFKEKKPLKIKAGFDPTAPDIHIGHTVLLEKMRQFQDLGHTVIFIIGDFTGLIGDPTGRSEIRKPLTQDDVLTNAETYKNQAFKILDAKKTQIRFNSEWLGTMSPLEFARLGSMQTVARMLEREDFKKRFQNQQDISILEFYYPLLQAYDSVKLKADLEIGGTDQKFNLLMGRTMQKRMGVAEQVVITMPLLEGTDGINKMSKSLGNYIGITDEPDEMYGKIMSISDELMLKYYELLSHISADELRTLKDRIKNGKIHPMKAKEDLAREIVQRYHGKEASISSTASFQQVHKEKGLPDKLSVFELTWENSEMWLPHIMKISGLAKSTSEAQRLIRQGAVTVNDEKCDSPDKSLPRGEYILKVGKRKFLKIISN
jgi:tyrosyl-tRNA synthetase